MENDADLQNKTNIPPNDLLDITEFLLTKTWFLFDGTFFKQTDGVAMVVFRKPTHTDQYLNYY